jgi:adenine-specific DNA-methyltransferase
MARYLEPKLSGRVLDPAVGPGALLSACAWTSRLGNVHAYEVDEGVLCSGDVTDATYPRSLMKKVHLESFLSAKSTRSYDAIIANPPYVRHHRIPGEVKDICQDIAREAIGTTLDRRAGLQVFFLLKALLGLAPGGRLSFLVPADVVEGVFAEALWRGICAKWRLVGVCTFDQSAEAFPGVDTHALVLYLENSAPRTTYDRLVWSGPPDDSFAEAVDEWQNGRSGAGLRVTSRGVAVGIGVGITRSSHNATTEGVAFSRLGRVMRGIATGDNSFFCFTRKEITEAGLNPRDFRRCIARVGDLDGDVVTSALLRKLDAKGRPTYLLNLTGASDLDCATARYIGTGVASGLSLRPLVSTRNPWYIMEQREVPPILVAYFGRRTERFIANTSSAVPLTGFLCVYPAADVDGSALLVALNHPDTGRCLADVGKSYGRGATKIEPGSLRKLIVPTSALRAAGITL